MAARSVTPPQNLATSGQPALSDDPTKQAAKIFNPWNPRNKELQLKDAIRILRLYGWKGRINDLVLFQKSCVHKSYVDRPDLWAEHSDNGEPMVMAERPNNCLGLREGDNEELEYLGDSVLGCIVATYLTQRYPGEGEGFLTRLRTRIVNNKMLGELAKQAGFGPWIILSRHVEDVCDGRQNLRMLGSMLEAWTGALYKQEPTPGRGFQACYDWLVTLMEKHIDFVTLIHEDTNYKDQLLRWFQATYHVPPRYKEVEVVGPPHDRIFTMGVLYPNGQIMAKATARNKKVAEQEASRLAMERVSGDVTNAPQDEK
jgi:ribonuclease-3